MRAKLVIAPGKEKAILRRHPWIFSGAVKRIEGALLEGDLVDVVDAHGQWMATGHYQNESIICKVLTFDADEASLPIEEILRRRIHSAVNYRVILGFFGDERTLDTHIKLLRKSLGEYSKCIVTLRGVGYRFETL